MDDDDPQDRVGCLVELLRSLPTGETVAWGADTAEDDGWIAGWCDIWAPELARPLGWSWVWTVTVEPGSSEGSPLYIELPGAQRTSGGPVGWSAQVVSRALERWVAERAGRGDLTFAFDPELTSDWMAAMIERVAQPSAPVAEGVDGLLHDLVERGGALVSACGAALPPDFVLRSPDVDLPADIDDEEFDRLLSQHCRDCSPGE